MLHTPSVDLQAKQEKVKSARNVIDDEASTASDDDIYYLYAVDFEEGTYRITKPGRYVVMEDIEFNPNRGSVAKGAANDDMEAWRPHADQEDVYPGAGGYRDAYFMGFWAAITVEASDVILDLNDHSIAMAEEFYYQQRWFTVIALSSQYFLPGQVLVH